MNIEEQIKLVEKTLSDKRNEMAKILGEAVEKGATPDEEQEQKIAAIEAEIEVLEKNLNRLEGIKKATEAAKNKATPVAGENPEQAKKAATGSIQVEDTLPPGIGFAQYTRAKMAAALAAKAGNFIAPHDMAKALGFNDSVVQFTKAATLGTTTNSGFAGVLTDPKTYSGEFIELLRNATVFDKLKGYRRVPFNVKIKGQLTGGTAQWVGEGKAKPLTNPTFGEVEIKEHKLAAITVYTQELMRRSDPAIDTLVRDDLIEAAKALIDTTFLGDGAQTAETPAGILNGVDAITSTGATADKVEADLLTLIKTFVEVNLSTDNSYFVMSETRAMQLALLRDALGNTYFNGMNLQGQRTLLGIPVVTSQSLGDKIMLIKMSEVLVAEDGGIDVSYSDQATLVDGETTHNLWQENKFAVRVEKFITWAKRRPIASAFIQY